MTGITENQQILSQSTAGNKCKMIIKNDSNKYHCYKFIL